MKPMENLGNLKYFVVYNVYFKDGSNATGRLSIERDFLIRSIDDVDNIEKEIETVVAMHYKQVQNVVITSIQQFPI